VYHTPTPAPTPAPLTNNDLCENALPLESFQTGSTALATVDNVGTCGFNNDNTAAGVWYTVSGISGPITVDTCSSSSNFDTKISVFQGSCRRIACVDGNDDDNSNCSLDGVVNSSRVTWTATALEQYFVLVHGFVDATGEFGLNMITDGNCNSSNSGVGCCNTECEAAVCASDSFCCDVNWDSVCATAACGGGEVCSSFPGACSGGCVA